MKKEDKGTVVRTPRDVKPTGVFKRILDADRKSGVADRVRHTAQGNAKKVSS